MSTSRLPILLALAAAALLLFPGEAEAQRRRSKRKGKQVKIATLAPEGTSWTRVLGDMDKDLTEETGGKLGLRLYAGGVQGNEKVVLRKMKLGQLHAFEEKGYVIIGWINIGFAYMYSNREIRTVEELRAAKAWLWEGDPLAAAAYDRSSSESC